jgi:hypothetical protein
MRWSEVLAADDLHMAFNPAGHHVWQLHQFPKLRLYCILILYAIKRYVLPCVLFDAESVIKQKYSG